MIGFVTIDVGEQALVYNIKGEGRIENGPKRIFLWREKFINLARFSADQKQYLIITHRNGTVKHLKGPCVKFYNPLKHSALCVKPMISLDANEAVVVYRQDPKTNDVTRYVKYGPTQFMPQSFEWLHEFCWHGTDPENKTHVLPGNLKFEKLLIIPGQFYYNVDEVRTADDALIRVKLMMFYELTDVEKMLNQTRDPIADFVNCLCADVVAFAAKRTYMEFIEQSSELNELSNYPQLADRSKVIGYEISKVVFRGYLAHDKLQRLHDVAIEMRTELKLEYEKMEQEQSLIDFKLQNETDRLNKEQEMELLEVNHSLKMEIEQLQHNLTKEKNQHERNLLEMKTEHEAELNVKRTSDKQEVTHLTNLHSLDVSLTEYLLTRSVRPEKITRIVSDSPQASLHFHHQ